MSEMAADARKLLNTLARALRDVHRTLVDMVRAEYEREWGPVNDGGHLLQLLTRHPQFDWLHHLSELMVVIDEMMDDESVLETDVRSIFAEAKSLITPSETGMSEFTQRYITLLQRDPNLVMAHANLQRTLATLPSS